MKRYSIIIIGVLLLLLAACRQSSVPLPVSQGQLYEVCVAGDADSAMCGVLSAPMEGLPQPEPMFDVRCIDSLRFESKMRLLRNLLVVRIDSNRKNAVTLRYEQNRYAHPQMIVYIEAGSANELKTYAQKRKEQIRQLFELHEYDNAIVSLARRNNPQAERMIAEMFGYKMLVPADMTSHRCGKDFIWLSNNATQGLQNLCIYTLKGIAEPSIGRIDSVLRVGIKGETDDMYMRTVARSTTDRVLTYRQRRYRLQRGLWEMEGDAMGGPFVRRFIADSIKDETLVVEAFVYAPEMKKRNKLRQIEAVLLTVKHI